ncbi:MAG TPA: LacI family transcriptional regulator, partial [Opitutus sp.]|nr:LacI family transcriptional regulator [Opitutus sp.]
RRQNVATLAYVTDSGGEWNWKTAPAHVQFFAGASNRATQLGYRLEHFWMGAPGLRQQRLSDVLYARGIAGVVFASQWSGADAAAHFEWPHFCAVKIDFLPRTPAIHNVTNDQRAIMQLAMRRVMAAGYKRIGCVMPQWWDELADSAWSAGFYAEQAKLSARDRLPILSYANTPTRRDPLSPLDMSVSATKFYTWLRRHRPEVLISYGPFVRKPLADLGVLIPRDFAYVDLYLETCDGATAGVRQNCDRVGEVAVDILTNQLQQHSYGLPRFATTTLVEGTWFDGRTLPARN